MNQVLIMIKGKAFGIIMLLLCVLTTSNSLQAQATLKFKDGQKICFIGNSITHGGAYHAFLQVFCATRFPDVKLEFHNCGVSGDAAWGMLRRFDEDVLVHQPDYAFLMTGMNDVLNYLYGVENPDSALLAKREENLQVYYKNTEKLVDLLVKNNIRPILMTPTIYDQTAKIDCENSFGVNDALGKCAIHIRKLAKKHNAPLIDFHRYLNAINTQEQKKDPAFTIIGKDRVHPQDPGHLLMAFEIIKTLYPASGNVSTIRINSRKHKVLKAENCKLKLSNKALTFEVKQNTLPFPISSALKAAWELIPYSQDFNNEILSISGLKKGKYKLLIDSEEVDVFSSKQLKKGVNLAHYQTTPQYKQAENILTLAMDYRRIQNKLRTLYMIEFRNLQEYKGDGSLASKRTYLEAKCESQKGKSWYPYMVKTTKEYFEDLPKKDELKQELEIARSRIYNANKTQWHSYELIKL